jgi:hypothetical protein
MTQANAAPETRSHELQAREGLDGAEVWIVDRPDVADELVAVADDQDDLAHRAQRSSYAASG